MSENLPFFKDIKGAFVVGSSASNPRSTRLSELERMKGFAILLVVWGHLASVTFFKAPLWFLISISVVYSFHMPLFMYVSGFVFFRSRYDERFWKGPMNYVVGRIDRLILPFFAAGLVITFGKFALASLGNIPDPVHSIWEGIYGIIFNTPNNPAASVWYLFVLFTYTIIAPILLRILNGNFYICLVVALSFWFVDATSLFYVDRILKFFVFFIMGGVAARNYDFVFEFFKRYFLYFLIAFLGTVTLFYRSDNALLICGAMSIPAMHGLFAQKWMHGDNFIRVIGGNSMSIYLFNTIVIGVCNIVLSRIFAFENTLFFIYAILVFFCGVGFPIIIRRMIEKVFILRIFGRYVA